MLVDQAADHRPVFVALGLLGKDEIGKREQINKLAFCFDRDATLPEQFEGWNTSQVGHQIDAEFVETWKTTAEVDRMTSGQKIAIEVRDRDWFSVQFIEREAEVL